MFQPLQEGFAINYLEYQFPIVRMSNNCLPIINNKMWQGKTVILLNKSTQFTLTIGREGIQFNKKINNYWFFVAAFYDHGSIIYARHDEGSLCPGGGQ